ncbi:MAG: BlaR1 peptidase M56 [Gelidibacter sp.]|nr:BlaR1 peptidase M56 [Gelidibacter sp.]
MINYILQVVLFQVLFLAVYDFFLQKETFFKWNRLYLLLTPLLAFVIPFLKFESLQKSVPTQYVEQFPTIFLNPEAIILQTVKMESSSNFMMVLFYVGIAFFSILFFIKLFNILKLIATNEVVKKENFNLVLLTKNASAFSFFNYIFIKKDFIAKKELSIIQHELVHSKQLHTLDLLFFEVLKIIMWFNPLIYVYQNRITLLHEYISDAEVVKETDKNDYFNSILSETFKVENISFINQFFKHSLIKKRIVMITKEKSQKLKQLKYLLIVPLLAGMLIYTACTNKTSDELSEIESVLNGITDFSKGQYFEFEIGKTFVGNSLMIGRYLEVHEYTAKEKEISEKFNSNDQLLFDHVVLLDENNVRVNWFRPKSLRLGSKSKWEYIEDEPVPFAIIDNAPVFPGCKGTEDELKACLQEQITAYVGANFNSGLAKGLGLEAGLNKIFVMFKIDNEGNVADVQARAPHKKLEEEAIRVIASLPKMIPGKQKGESVAVKYSLPIAFMVE